MSYTFTRPMVQCLFCKGGTGSINRALPLQKLYAYAVRRRFGSTPIRLEGNSEQQWPTQNTRHPMHSNLLSESLRVLDMDQRCRVGVQVRDDLKALIVTGKQATSTFPYTFLRDLCSCPHCIDPSTTQKQFQSSDIPENITIKAVRIDEQGCHLYWDHDIDGYGEDHVTNFSCNWLSNQADSMGLEEKPNGLPNESPWGKDAISVFPKLGENFSCGLEYSDICQEDSSLLTALRHLKEYGLVFIHNVPDSPNSIEVITSRIGGLRHTFYGKTWDVKSKPNAENVAYTNKHLGLHMDLLYMADPPGLQLLHCLRSSCNGGESIFSDALNAAVILRWSRIELFKSLLQFPVSYRYFNGDQRYHYTRPTIELDNFPTFETGDLLVTDHYAQIHSKIKHVNWSPPFQAPFTPRRAFPSTFSESFRLYLAAAREFDKIVNSPDMVLEKRLEPGQCVIFNNRRVLHARKAFDTNSGERWLKGGYVDTDVWMSKLRSLSRDTFDPTWKTH
ncbi:MAG: hypothetical protein M1834_004404 [Cirrosporium novae-zelandiae]|nr:MAG: hypothetical protein M1834_004404 [Cirrosporium novae-zelandiae]